MPPAVVGAFRNSLKSSPFGFLRVWSTPTLPNYGVSLLYDQSDRKRWHYKCKKCGHWQYLTLANVHQINGPASLMQRLETHDPTAVIKDGDFQYIYVKCHRFLARVHAKCEWISERPDVTEYSGYYLSQMDAAWITADTLMRDLRDTRPGLQLFYNYNLGLEYLGDAGKLDDGWMYTLVNPEIPRFDSRAYHRTAL